MPISSDPPLQQLRIGGLQKSSTLDFPGVLAAVLFLRGCDLNCFYCHNRELLGAGPCLPWEEINRFLRKRQGLLDGMVISGGEPCLQPRGLVALCRELHQLGYRVKLDSNGMHPRVVENLLEQNLLDYVAIDSKALPSAYPEVCGGGSFALMLETLRRLEASGIAYEARSTLYPGMQKEELLSLARSLPRLPRWRLNFYREPPLLRAEDRGKASRYALRADDLYPILPQLLALQPGLIYPSL